jgi:peptidylprolyl isomerase
MLRPLLLPRVGCPLLLGLVFACRPEGYRPSPAPVEPRLRPELSQGATEDERLHQALFGADSAPPSLLRPPPNATVSPSGLAEVVLRPGTGDKAPSPDDTVVVHFVGWDQAGDRFDSSFARGKPDRLRLSEMMPGLREGLLRMVIGEKRRLWIPERLAYGAVASPGRPAGDLVMDVELLDIQVAPTLPQAPPDLADPGPDALTTSSGLRSKVLKAGTGTVRPKRTDRVLVHYSGWTLDGTMFDSSIARGEPVAFGVDEVIPGWTEALMLMVEGESRRLWIPANLAYGETPRPGAPAGPLVFDVELLQIQD